MQTFTTLTNKNQIPFPLQNKKTLCKNCLVKKLA